ncbi:MAG: DNA polymerase III subunit epsilon [Microbacteriaceae bacterium]|nr:DNA polymerase III subunit epsilon [Microbacteriaceae bacterium]
MVTRGFAIIDFETTGLFPEGTDRVIEVAVVHLDPDGTVTGRWDTLVNPQRDLGPQRIHRIGGAEVMNAPTFVQIAPKLVELLSGRVLVAHNASFDSRFLLAELARAGYWAPAKLEVLCTMQLAREFLPGAGRALKDCCDAFDIALIGAHRASVDAFATAQLLDAYLLSRPHWPASIAALERAAFEWPKLAGASVGWMPRADSITAQTPFLERISIKLPEYAGPSEHLDYLALVDRCLLDRVISAHEANSLVDLAETVGISRQTCASLNRRYFADLVEVAWSDGVLTDAEIADLTLVALLLSIPATEARAAMAPQKLTIGQVAAAVGGAGTVGAGLAGIATFRLSPGDRIVLTGEMARTRDDWHEQLVSCGFVPWPAVTKKVQLLVAADPDSPSGKARKARDFNITIVGEAGLYRLLGLST